MCGRNAVFHPAPLLEETFSATMAIDDYRPRYNIAPQQNHPVISNETTDEINEATWGLAPHWMDDPNKGFINARAETAHEKPAFRDAWANRPCLVLSSGFYEWKQSNGGSKQPYRIHRSDGRPFAMAGLWEPPATEARTSPTMTILTTDPNDTVAPIHDRMPVVLRHDDVSDWLTGDAEDRQALCRPYPEDDLTAYPISTRVNNPSNDDPQVIEPTETEQSGLDEFR